MDVTLLQVHDAWQIHISTFYCLKKNKHFGQFCLSFATPVKIHSYFPKKEIITCTYIHSKKAKAAKLQN